MHEKRQDWLDKTAPTWQKWVDDLFEGKHGRFCCFEDIDRWEPLPWHPRLKTLW